MHTSLVLLLPRPNQTLRNESRGTDFEQKWNCNQGLALELSTRMHNNETTNHLRIYPTTACWSEPRIFVPKMSYWHLKAFISIIIHSSDWKIVQLQNVPLVQVPVCPARMHGCHTWTSRTCCTNHSEPLWLNWLRNDRITVQQAFDELILRPIKG